MLIKKWVRRVCNQDMGVENMDAYEKRLQQRLN